MAGIRKKSFEDPNERIEIEKCICDVVTASGVTVSRLTLEPGWVFTKHAGPAMGEEVDYCTSPHPIWLVLSGRMAIQMIDGGETIEYGPGDIGEVGPNHDAWVIGDENAVAIDVAVGEPRGGP